MYRCCHAGGIQSSVVIGGGYLKHGHFITYIVFALLGFSIITVYSTDLATFGAGGKNYQLTKHLLWIFIGLVLLITMSKVDYHYLQKLGIPLLVLSFVLLMLVLLPGIGTVTNGARRWIRLGHIFGIQPTEFAKLAVIIFISGYITKNQKRMSEFKCGFMIPVVIVAATGVLIIKEPDFGSAAFITILSVVMLIVGGVRIVYIFFMTVAVVPFVYEMLFKVSYRKDRLMSFMDPWQDPSGTGYHVIQSWIALGSGGLTGLGIGSSKQKLFFLPESSSDFIFTIIGEEFGFLGALVIISLFLLLIWQGLRTVQATKDIFGFFLGFGITAMFGLQAVINIAVVSGIVPTKGIPLPFVSSGGSSLLFSMIAVGILINIAKQSLGQEISSPQVNSEPLEDKANGLLPVRILHTTISKIAKFSW